MAMNAAPRLNTREENHSVLTKTTCAGVRVGADEELIKAASMVCVIAVCPALATSMLNCADMIMRA